MSKKYKIIVRGIVSSLIYFMKNDGQWPEDIIKREKEERHVGISKLFNMDLISDQERNLLEKEHWDLTETFRVIARNANGELMGFSNSAKTEGFQKYKNRASEHIQSLLVGSYNPKMKGIEKLPPHFRKYLKRAGINVPWVEACASTLKEIRFSVEGRSAHIIYRTTEEADDAFRSNTVRDIFPAPGARRLYGCKIIACKNPKVIITKKGLTIPGPLPHALTQIMPGQRLDTYARVPTLENAVIKSVRRNKKAISFTIE